MAKKKQFKTESKRLLDLMINSIYTNKEIFLREIISNASDAIDKLYYKKASSGKTGLSRDDFEIRITPDKDARTLTVSDNGIGMSAEELDKNLGVIAQSGSLNFKKSMSEDEADDGEVLSGATDIIGQFGVGFYSAFMVSKKIEVLSRAYGSDKANLWVSSGADGYSIDTAKRDEVGTTITLTLRDDSEESDGERYSQYLEESTIRMLVRKYSDYIRYPIVMNVEKSRMKPATDEEKKADDYKPEYESYREDDTLNSMVPIWKRKKSDIKDEDYNEFYKNKFFDWHDPLKVIHTNVEGVISYDALLFIPSEVPFNYYTKDFRRGLQLYSSGVLVMDKCEDLLPDYFSFISGLVDSQDLSLNISREMLQQDRQLKAIAQRIEKKISQTLSDMMEKERDKYDKLFANFGMQLKYGIYEEFGRNKDKLKDLIMFYSNTTEKLSSLKEYISRMPESQKYIYYAAGTSRDQLKRMPQLDTFKDNGYEVMFCTDEIDEFAIRILSEYDGKEFRNVSEKDTGFEISDEEKKASEKKNEDEKAVLNAVKDVLGDKVSDVILSTRLKSNPVCFATGEGMSIEMEKTLRQQAMLTGNKDMSELKAEKILELNSNHAFYSSLKAAVESGDNDKIANYSTLLYDQALLIEGMPIEDPVEFSNLICNLM